MEEGQEVSTCDGKNAHTSQHCEVADKMAAHSSEPKGSLLKSEPVVQPRPEHSLSVAKSRRSSTTSTEARRIRLLFEAEQQKAAIKMQLIDKRLAADLADLEDERYSSHESIEVTRRNVEQWMEENAKGHVTEPPQSHLEPPQPQPQPAPGYGMSTGNLHKADADASDRTIQMLASAVQNLTTSSGHHKPNANLLSRICTPRDLPEYHGDPLDWLQFKQAYEESTDVCNFSPKENLWRLRKCLRGPAKEAVSALLISASSPDKIMATLQLRFGDPDCILNRLVLDIKKLQPISHDYQKEIVIFSVKVQNFVEAVKVVGREEYIQGMSIVPLLLSKLPTLLLSKWSDYSFPLINSGINKSRLDILSDFLNMEAMKIATTANIHHTLSYRSDQHKYKHHDTNNRPQVVLLQTEEPVSGDNNKCNFCRKSQCRKLSECKQFKKALRKVRWQYVKRNGICFKCLDSRHERETCPAPVCDKEECGRAHHRMLHYNVNNNSQGGSPGQAAARERDSQSADAPAPEVVTHVNLSCNRVLLKVVPVRIHTADGAVIHSSALLDDGSTVTLISAALAERAGLRGRRESMRVCGPWSESEIVCDSTILELRLSDIDDKVHSIKARSWCIHGNVVVRGTAGAARAALCIASAGANAGAAGAALSTAGAGADTGAGAGAAMQWPLAMSTGANADAAGAALSTAGAGAATQWPLAMSAGANAGAAGAALSTAGAGAAMQWPLAMSAGANAGAAGAALSTAGAGADTGAGAGAAMQWETRALRDLHEEVRRAFALDAAGVTSRPRQNADDARAVEQLERSAELVDGRWRVGLPWKDPECAMPDTMPDALKRLRGIERKMARDQQYADRYVERVHHLFENDFARELEDTRRTQRTWYLSHFGVDNPNKKKLRLVFDAADSTNGTCLNDYLLKGPDLLTSLWVSCYASG
ncbi:uncharacterized protein [Choristoneura fumiferana]|uniref:uncharacterized protein n=1 Tax=Choristoneura fumiferana TaxID=7141 RepID=UPI003D15C9EE